MAPFGQGGLGSSDELVPLVQTFSPVREATQRAVSAYRRNMALPDVHVIDRHDRSEPSVVGEDGQAMTPERRAELMREAGIKPMFDESGEPNNSDYTGAFDSVIDTERLGQSAESNRRNSILIVQPKEIDLHHDIDSTTVDSADGVAFVPGVDGSAIPVDPSKILFSTGACYINGVEALWAAVAECGKVFSKGGGAKSMHMSERMYAWIRDYAEDTHASCFDWWGVSAVVWSDEHLVNEIRIFGDPEVFKGQYAVAFIDPSIFEFDIETDRLENPDA